MLFILWVRVPVWTYVSLCMLGALGGQEEGLCLLELELQAAMSGHVGAGNQAQAPVTAVNALNC